MKPEASTFHKISSHTAPKIWQVVPLVLFLSSNLILFIGPTFSKYYALNPPGIEPTVSVGIQHQHTTFIYGEQIMLLASRGSRQLAGNLRSRKVVLQVFRR